VFVSANPAAKHANQHGAFLSIRETRRPRIDPYSNFLYAKRMAKKAAANVGQASRLSPKSEKNETGRMPVLRPSPLLDTRVVYCGDNLEKLAKARTRSCGRSSVRTF
jgi:hypothetical protein